MHSPSFANISQSINPNIAKVELSTAETAAAAAQVSMQTFQCKQFINLLK
jgi:hypothetical protein